MKLLTAFVLSYSWLMAFFYTSTTLFGVDSKRKSLSVSDSTTAVLGIGYLVDSSSNLSQNFAFYQFLKDNPIYLGPNSLKVVLTDQPFTTHYALTGYIRRKHLDIQIWQKGRIIDKATLSINTHDLPTTFRAMYGHVATILLDVKAGAEAIRRARSDKGILVDSHIRIAAKRGSDLLPGRVQCPVPPSTYLSELSQHLGIDNFIVPKSLRKIKDPVQVAQLAYALYEHDDESTFILSSNNVPAELKSNVRKLMFPANSRIGVPLIYLAAAEKFEAASDTGGAASAYYAALIACNNLNGSPFEKAAVKRICFKQLCRIKERQNKPLSASLMNLAFSVNDRYLKSDLAVKEREHYYDAVTKIADICNEVEVKLKEVRATKRKNGLFAALNLAAGVTSAAVGDQISSDVYSKQFGELIGQNMELSSQTSAALNEAMRAFEDTYAAKIDDMVRNEGEQINAGNTYLASEITYHLLHTDSESVLQALKDFARDKPKLNATAHQYAAETQAATRDNLLADLRKQLMRIEGQAYLHEHSGRRIPDLAITSF